MKKVIEYIEENYLSDPVVFQWVNMRKKGTVSDEGAVIGLITALIGNKNIAIRALNRREQKSKVLDFKKPGA